MSSGNVMFLIGAIVLGLGLAFLVGVTLFQLAALFARRAREALSLSRLRWAMDVLATMGRQRPRGARR